MDWRQKIDEWVNGPCISCEESSSSPVGVEHVGMPVARPGYVDEYLEGLAGPNEQHSEDPDAHCVNPKCGYHFTPEDERQIHEDGGEFTCPQCGFTYNYLKETPTYDGGEWAFDSPDVDTSILKTRPANPGGMTRSGLSLDQMGQLGEQIVLRMGELPGIGPIYPASNEKNFPIDAIIESQRGKFGVEIKTNHSQAQERFKIGGKDERLSKIQYCLEHGMKPALVGVRLNFYTDKAYIFFREGLTDTWIGNQKMLHLATFDFADMNPFKSPDPQAQALAVDNAHLPDQATEEDEFDHIFGPQHAVAHVAHDDNQPRKEDGTFTFKSDVHEVKVRDKKGKHVHSLKRCKHCGAVYGKTSDHMGRVECPTCGKDPERKLAEAKVVLGGPSADEYAKQLGFSFLGRNNNGHRTYNWTDPAGTTHLVVVGSGTHGKNAADIDATYARQRMSKCLNGKCSHVATPPEVNVLDAPEAPIFRTGQTIQTAAEQFGTVLDTNGEAALIQNFQTGQKEWVPADQLRAVAASDPAYVYVYYMGELHVEPWTPNVKYEPMLKQLMAQFNVDLGNTGMDIDPTQVDAGEIRPRGFSVAIEHKQLSDPTVREYAERAVHDWWNRKQLDDPWFSLQRDDHVLEPRA